MRTSVLAALVVVLGASVADAQKKKAKADAGSAVIGTYEVRYEEVSSNCSQTSISLTRGSLDITKAKKQIVVDIQRFPLMYGTPGKGGRVRASSKMAPSSIDGVDGKFSVAGRVDEGLISLVFVAEYYVDGKPLCSQTWNVSGQKTQSATARNKKTKKSSK
jgi:hypothetical protein